MISRLKHFMVGFHKPNTNPPPFFRFGTGSCRLGMHGAETSNSTYWKRLEQRLQFATCTCEMLKIIGGFQEKFCHTKYWDSAKLFYFREHFISQYFLRKINSSGHSRMSSDNDNRDTIGDYYYQTTYGRETSSFFNSSINHC